MRTARFIVLVIIALLITNCTKRIIPNYKFKYSDYLYNDNFWRCILDGEDLRQVDSHEDLIDYLNAKYYNLSGDNQNKIAFPAIDVDGQNQIVPLYLDKGKETHNMLIANVIDNKGNLVSGLSLRDFHAKDDNIELLDLNSQLSDYKFPIDIVVVIDQSASMVDNIQDFKNNISKFLKLLESVNVDWRLGLVVYGDKITNKSELGKELSTFLDNFPKSLTGGAEIAEDALYSLTSFNFRPAAQKVAILCTDELVFQGFSEIEDCNMIQSLIHKGIRVFQALPPDNRNSEFLSILTRGKIYNLYDKFETILPAIGHYLTNFYYINYYEIPKNQKRQMDIDIDKGNVDLQKYRINPFPLGYYKPFIKKNLLNYQRWLKINPNLNSASKLNKEYSKIIKDEKTQVHLQYILDGVADKISDYLYDLNESDSKKSKLIIELTGFTDNLQVHSLQNIDDYLILEGKEIGLRYGSNKELAYLRAYHTWKDLRELIMQKDPNDYFSKLLAQNRIIINYTYFYPDGRNPRLESDSKDLDIKHLRKVIIKYWKEK